MADPLWQKNLIDAVRMNPLVLAHGNTKDLYPVPPTSIVPSGVAPYVPFDVWLALQLELEGYKTIILYDPADGAVALRGPMAVHFSQAASQSGAATAQSASAPSATTPSLPRATTQPTPADGWLLRIEPRQRPDAFLRTLYDSILPSTEHACAVVCRFTDRYISFTDRQSSEDRSLSLMFQKAALAVAQPKDDKAASRLILLFNTEGEIPQELNTQAPFSKSVAVPVPTLEERERFFRDNQTRFDPGGGQRFDSSADDGADLRLVANLSDGLDYHDLLGLITLSRAERIGLGREQVKTLIDLFRFGTRENAWLKVKPETLLKAKELLARRVKGQDEVIDEVVPVLIRAKLGMSDIGGSARSGKPRGAFFFVGPTGVGKTELSKAIAELIFGDEAALIRFDMSEYSEEHQQARLIGAPPGYVGFDQGGQLTNSVLAKPFSVVLFDEIEKAHGRILDKFLQILDDGRLTDGMGRTVYFSESILIFTSNLGTAPRIGSSSRANAAGASIGPVQSSGTSGVYARLAEMQYPQLADHFRSEVKDFFVNTLGRPEILNRIGEDNILVFRFLVDSAAKLAIVDQQVDNMNNQLERHQVRVYPTRAFRKMLMVHPSGFTRNGARGVRNLLTKWVINRLATDLFLDPGQCERRTLRVDYRAPDDHFDPASFLFDPSLIAYQWIDARAATAE